jgi:hypothetical protein
MRVALVGCTIAHADAAVATANATRAILTIRLRCRWVPEFRALTDPSEVDVFDFLRRQQTRRGEQKEQKSSSKKHGQIAAVSISEGKFISRSAPSA